MNTHMRKPQMNRAMVNNGTLEVCLVQREQLRLGAGTPKLHLSRTKPSAPEGAQLPDPPTSRDWRGSTPMPILGNDRYGICFYSAMWHAVQTWLGARGQSVTPDLVKLIARYLHLSGGDNGLDWGTIKPEWVGGITGPNGPRKALGFGAVAPNDQRTIQSVVDCAGGIMLTLGIPDRWLQSYSFPGGVWDAGAGVRANDRNGHAIWVTGYDSQGVRGETWGFTPGVMITWGGLRVCDAELAAVAGADWIGAGDKTPQGQTRQQYHDWWHAIGGDPLPAPAPPNPTPPGPNPGPGPVPPVPGPLLLPTFDCVLSGSMPGGAVSLSGTLTPRAVAGEVGSADRDRLMAARPPSITPEQWQAIIEAILRLLPIFFPPK